MKSIIKKSIFILFVLFSISWGCLSCADTSTGIKKPCANELCTNIVVNADELKKSLGNIHLSANFEVRAVGDKAWTADDSLNQHQMLVEIINLVDRFHAEIKNQQLSNASNIYSLEGLLTFKRVFFNMIDDEDYEDYEGYEGYEDYEVIDSVECDFVKTDSTVVHTNDLIEMLSDKIIERIDERDNSNIEHGIEVETIVFNDQNRTALVQFISLENGIPNQQPSHLDLVKVDGEWKVSSYYLLKHILDLSGDEEDEDEDKTTISKKVL